MTPTVNYGSSSGSLTNTATVCWNPNTNKWLADMDVPDTCGGKWCTVYWAATVTFCDSTGTSAEQSHSYQMTTDPCKDPLFCD